MKRLMLLCGLVALLAVPAALAGTSKTFSVDQTGVAYGDTVTFSYSGYNASSVSVDCLKADGTEVYYAVQDARSAFVLSGWDGSATVCYAGLHGNRQLLATLTFQVAGT